jgi:hypothetical protein
MLGLAVLAAVAALAVVPRNGFAEAAVEIEGKGQVAYRLVHTFHTVTGTSPALAVRGSVDAGGLRVMARAPVKSFDSGNANRDAHMMEAVEGERYPWVSVRAALPGFALPTQAGTSKLKLDAAVELHGVTVNHPIDVELVAKDSEHFQVRFHFVEKLTAHKVERPSLLFVPVDDEITISGEAEIQAKRP